MSSFILYLLLFWLFLLSSKWWHAHHIQKPKCSNTFRIKKNRWMNFWVTQMSHGGWRYVYILKWTATTQYEEIPFFLSSLYTVLHVRFEFRHISFPPTHQLAIGVDFDVWTTIASVCRLNCKFPESLVIFNWNLSRILEFPFGLSRFVNHKKTRPHWFGRKLSQTEKVNRTDTPYSSANFVYKL